MRWLLAVALVGGCARIDPVPDVAVTSATLEDLDTNALVLLAGPAGGDALLVWDGPQGGGALPVSVNGGGLGLVMDMSLDLLPGSDVPLDLSEADADLRLRDLLGTYTGSSVSGAVVIGGEAQHLRNGHGVRIAESSLTLGISIEAGLRWLRIKQGGDDGDTGPYPVVPRETGDTADTGRDTAAPIPPATGGDTGERGGGDGCGCRGDGGGCGCGSECDSCSTGAAFLPAGILLGTWLRRRRR